MDLRPGFWMTVTAWLDGDGRHVWVGHDCATERVVTMLPWPRWHSTGFDVAPSFSCEGCGVHTHVQLGVPDEDHRCMSTWEFDGRWCERIVDHGGLHRNANVEWGTYVDA